MLAEEDVGRYMQANIKKQPISSVYKDNPYNYKFDNGKNLTIVVPVDVTTTWYNATVATNQLTNGMKALLPSANTHCSNFIPNFTMHGGQLFLTK